LHSLIPCLTLFCQLSTRNSTQFSSLLQLPSLLRRATLSTTCSLGTPELDSILLSTAANYLSFNSSCVRSSIITSGPTHRKRRFLCCCVLIQCCRDAFTAQLRSNERGADPQRTPLAPPLLLLLDVTAYMTRSSAACVRAIT
jgi:hypothetical protein